MPAAESSLHRSRRQFRQKPRQDLTIYLFHFFFAWVISVITGFSLRYANPAPADVIWKSALVALGAFLLSVLRAVIGNRLEEKNGQ